MKLLGCGVERQNLLSYRGIVQNPIVEVRRSHRRRKTVAVRREGEKFIVLAPALLSQRKLNAMIPELIERLRQREDNRAVPDSPNDLTKRGQELFSKYLARAVGEPLPSFSAVWVTNQQHRWGSCTPSDGTIRLSDRLRGLPDWVVDYVLLHEVLHLIEHGHTARFHSLLSQYPLAERARGYLEGYQARNY